jgi:hypothetical protein
MAEYQFHGMKVWKNKKEKNKAGVKGLFYDGPVIEGDAPFGIETRIASGGTRTTYWGLPIGEKKENSSSGLFFFKGKKKYMLKFWSEELSEEIPFIKIASTVCEALAADPLLTTDNPNKISEIIQTVGTKAMKKLLYMKEKIEKKALPKMQPYERFVLKPGEDFEIPYNYPLYRKGENKPYKYVRLHFRASNTRGKNFEPIPNNFLKAMANRDKSRQGLSKTSADDVINLTGNTQENIINLATNQPKKKKQNTEVIDLTGNNKENMKSNDGVTSSTNDTEEREKKGKKEVYTLWSNEGNPIGKLKRLAKTRPNVKELLNEGVRVEDLSLFRSAQNKELNYPNYKPQFPYGFVYQDTTNAFRYFFKNRNGRQKSMNARRLIHSLKEHPTRYEGESLDERYRRFARNLNNERERHLADFNRDHDLQEQAKIRYQSLEDKHNSLPNAQKTGQFTQVFHDSLGSYLYELFDQKGYFKNAAQIIGFVGPLTKLSINEQIRESASENAEDQCTFRPYSYSTFKKRPLLPQQGIVHAMATLRARNWIKTPGLLAYHSTGSGKTLEGLVVMIRFWNKPYGIVSLAVRSNQSDNSLEKLAILAHAHFPDFIDNNKTFPFKTKESAYVHLFERIVRGYEIVIDDTHKFAKWSKEANIPSKDTREMHYKILFDAQNPSYASMKEQYKLKETRLLATYNTFANDYETKILPKKLSRCVFILDEAQFLVGATASTEKGRERHYAITYAAIMNRNIDDTWVFMSTATPGSNARQFMKLLDLLRGDMIASSRLLNKDGLFNSKKVAVFHKTAKDLISYCNNAGNRSQFAKIDIIAECAPATQKYQKLFYKGILERYKRYHQGFDANKLMFRAATKAKEYLDEISNIPTEAVKEEAQDPSKKLKYPNRTQFRPQNQSFDFKDYWRHIVSLGLFRPIQGEESTLNTNEIPKKGFFNPFVTFHLNLLGSKSNITSRKFFVGPKIALLLKRIQQNNGLHYVYVDNLVALKIIAYLLKTKLNLTLFKSTTRAASLPTSSKQPSSFGFATTIQSSDRSRELKETLGFYDPKKEKLIWTQQDKENLLRAASSPENVSGKRVKVILAQKDAFKGVDVKNIRHLHLVSPLGLDFNQFLQFVGRGSRFCSHSAIKNMSKRVVKVHTYRLLPASTSGKRNKRKLISEFSDKSCEEIFSEKKYEDLLPAYADCYLWKCGWKYYKRQWEALQNEIRLVAVDSKIFDPFTRNIRNLEDGLHLIKCQNIVIDPYSHDDDTNPATNEDNNNEDDNDDPLQDIFVDIPTTENQVDAWLQRQRDTKNDSHMTLRRNPEVRASEYKKLLRNHELYFKYLSHEGRNLPRDRATLKKVREFQRKYRAILEPLRAERES